MEKLTTASKIIILAVLAAVLVVLVIVYSSGSAGTTIANNAIPNGPQNAALTAASPTQAQIPTSTTTNTGNAIPKLRGTIIHFVTPVAKDIWSIGTQNVISWDKPGGITGSISLINAISGAPIGVVLPQIGPNQTSYTWNTRDLLLNRTDPSKKDVVAGTYMLKLTFDGNNILPALSPSFTITN